MRKLVYVDGKSGDQLYRTCGKVLRFEGKYRSGEPIRDREKLIELIEKAGVFTV